MRSLRVIESSEGRLKMLVVRWFGSMCLVLCYLFLVFSSCAAVPKKPASALDDVFDEDFGNYIGKGALTQGTENVSENNGDYDEEEIDRDMEEGNKHGRNNKDHDADIRENGEEENENVDENNNGDENDQDKLDENNEGNNIEGQYEDRRWRGRAVRVLDF